MKFSRLESEKEVLDLINHHNRYSSHVVIDVETTSVQPRKAELLDIQISGLTEDSAVIFSQEYRNTLLKLDTKLVLVAHNYKYDAHVLFRHGVDLLDRQWVDTLLMGHLLDENRESYSLDSYVKEIWNDPYKEEFWKKYQSYQEASPQDALEYACKDVVYTGLLYRRHRARAFEDGIPESLLEHVHRLQRSLLSTEILGLCIDLDYTESLGVKLRTRIDQLGPEMRCLVKDEIELLELASWQTELDKRKTDRGKSLVKRPSFSFESSQQLQRLLFDRLALPVQRNEKTRAVSTDYASLEKIKEAHPVVRLIQENRELQKVYTAYIEGTLDRADGGRIYPEFRVSGTKGSRISHQNPNLGQMPATGGVKGIYVPDPGHLFSELDYAQLEVCIEAHYTQDKNLLEIVLNNASKHDITATNLKIERSLAKTLNFGMQYRCSHFKIAKILGISEKEAQYVYNRYWETYSGVARLHKETDALINRGEPIVDLFGRKRRFEMRKRHPWDKDYRSGYNFKIQSTGGQLMNNAFYRSSEWLERTKTGRAVLTVHDSCLVASKIGCVESVCAGVENFMVKEGELIQLSVPLKVSRKIGMPRWEDK